MRPAATLLLGAALLAAGCARVDPGEGDAGEYVVVDPPEDGGGFAPCATRDSQPLAVPFRAEATTDAGGREAGIHRLDGTTFLFVWAVREDSLREDRVTRVNPVDVYREPAGRIHVCTSVDIAAPQEVDGERRTYAVAALFTATTGMPEGPLRVLVNWVAGCLCDPLPRGNATADFP